MTGTTVVGQVVGGAGDDPTAARVELLGATVEPGIPDADGRFVFAAALPDGGPFAVRVTWAGFVELERFDVADPFAAQHDVGALHPRPESETEAAVSLEGHARLEAADSHGGVVVEVSRNGRAVATTQTDAEGRYVVPASRVDYQLRFVHAGYDPAEVDVVWADGFRVGDVPLVDYDDAVLPRDTSGALTGQLLSPVEGFDFADAVVSLTGVGAARRAMVAGDGHFEARGLQPGTYGLEVDVPGHLPAARFVEVVPGETALDPIELRAEFEAPEQAPTLRGRATLAEADDHSGVLVQAYLEQALVASTLTDVAGDYAFPAARTTFRLTFNRAGYVADELPAVAWSDVRERFEVDAEPAFPVALALDRSAHAAGVLVSRRADTDFASTRVTLRCIEDPCRGAVRVLTVAEVDGAWRFSTEAPLVPAVHELEAALVGHRPVLRAAVLARGDNDLGAVELVHDADSVAAVQLAGRALPADDAPPAGTVIRIRRAVDDVLFATTLSDDTGGFAVAASRFEAYTVTARREGYAEGPATEPPRWNAARGRFEDADGDAPELLLRPEPIRGQVDVELEVLPDWIPDDQRTATVTIRSADYFDEQSAVRHNIDGDPAPLTQLPAGTYEVEARRPGFESVRSVVTISEDGQREVVRLTLRATDLDPAGLDLDGRVLADDDLRDPTLQLAGADLSGVVVRDERRLDAGPADLSGLALRGVDLRGADLEGALLSGADLTAADLGGANLANARLHRAVSDAPVFQIDDFAGAPLTLNGDATISAGRLAVTPLARDQAGSAWTEDPVDIGEGFDSAFLFHISPVGGADGMAFVLQAEGPAALGGIGGALGYDGIARSVAVEIDTWPGPGDPNGNHVAVHVGGDSTQSVAVAAELPELQGTTHLLRVRAADGTLTVELDGAPIIETALDLRAALGADAARFGFTAGTGGSDQSHEVLAWTLARADGGPAGPPTQLVGANLSGADLRGARFHPEIGALVRPGCDGGSPGVVLTGARFERTNLRLAQLQGMRMEGIDLASATLVRASLAGACLRGANLTLANLSGVDLDDADLSEAHLVNAILAPAAGDDGLVPTSARRADFQDAVMVGAIIEAGDLTGANLEGANLTGANLVDADLSGVSAARASLISVIVSDTSFRGADLSGASCLGVLFAAADLRDVDFTGAELRNTEFVDVQVAGTTFTGARLQNAGLHGLVAPGISFRGADLRGADLGSADLAGAGLDEADLRDARLTEAELGFANLRQAVLAGADLRGAVLLHNNAVGANLRGADLRSVSGMCFVDADRAFYDDDTQWPDGFDPLAADCADPFDPPYFIGRNAALQGAQLDGADLSNARLDDADLTGASLRGVDLRNTGLSRTVLEGADLSGASFLGFLFRTELTNADVTDAVFVTPQFCGSDLTGTDLTAATLTDAVFAAATCPDGTDSGGGLNGVNCDPRGSCEGHLAP